MAFGKKYIVRFVSLRGATVYDACIWEDGWSGQPQMLTGSAQPMVTTEDDDEDVFCDIRTQTGSIRVVDTGGVNWQNIMPKSDLAKPVTLEVGGEPVWVGYLQSESYSGVLYGNPQEREFPVQCPLSVLQAIQVSTSVTELKNFAYILKYILDSLPSYTNNASDPVINRVIVGGGADARQWLLNRVDWQNFIAQDDDGNDKPRYNLYEILEDVCRFWGWTARIMNRTLYLTCMDDATEGGSLLTLTYSQLTRLATAASASDKAAGTVSSRQSAVAISGNVFVDTDNEDYQLRGPSKATVKSDCNQQDTVIQFAPKIVESQLGSQWIWEQGDEDLVGFFTTETRDSQTQKLIPVYSFTSALMDGTAVIFPAAAPGQAGFCRRQIYSSKDSDSSIDSDMINVAGHSILSQSALVSLDIKRWRNYGGGSLSLKGQLYDGANNFEGSETCIMLMSIGIGSSRATAQWFYLMHSDGGVISSGWSSQKRRVGLPIESNTLQGFTAINVDAATASQSEAGYISKWGLFQSIPVANGLSGMLFVDFYGITEPIGAGAYRDLIAQIANFEVDFSRDVTAITTGTDIVRPRTMKEERESEREYVSDNNGQTHAEWNADCIYASDQNMEYGYGLLIDQNGDFMAQAPYGSTSEYPEQHLANRVTSFWQQAKRKLSIRVTKEAAANVSPIRPVSIDGTTGQAISISHDWRDDVTKLGIVELN